MKNNLSVQPAFVQKSSRKLSLFMATLHSNYPAFYREEPPCCLINEAIFLEQCITIATTAPVYQGESVAAFYLSRSLAASYSAIPILPESRFDP